MMCMPPDRSPVVFKGIVDCIVKTVKHDGFVGLYKGILPNFAKSLPAISLSYTGAVNITFLSRLSANLLIPVFRSV